MLHAGQQIYIATNKGTVDILHLKTEKITGQIKLPLIKDFTGEKISPAIYSVDVLPGSQKVLITSQGEEGFSNLFSYNNRLLEQIINSEQTKITIREARFVDKKTVLLALLSNELVLFDVERKKELYRKQVNTSSFSDMQMDESRSKVVLADESGVIHLVDINSGRILKEFQGLNYDRVFKLDYKEHRIICGSQDRRVSVYHELIDESFFIELEWPVYVVSLSPDGSLGAFSIAENMGVTIFDILTHEQIFTLDTQGSSISSILFLSKDEIIAASEDSKLFYWKLS